MSTPFLALKPWIPVVLCWGQFLTAKHLWKRGSLRGRGNFTQISKLLQGFLEYFQVQRWPTASIKMFLIKQFFDSPNLKLCTKWLLFPPWRHSCLFQEKHSHFVRKHTTEKQTNKKPQEKRFGEQVLYPVKLCRAFTPESNTSSHKEIAAFLSRQGRW